jgi:hypothetical protein
MTGTLNAWIDFNADGDWADPGEQIFSDQWVFMFPNNLTFAVPAGAVPGPTYARFRLNWGGGLSYDGPADNGEVEDYLVEIIPFVDRKAPTSWAKRLRRIRLNPIFRVQWTGDDFDGSGIKCYDVQYRDGTGRWRDWMTCTTDTSAKFLGRRGHTYSFRVRATDNAGNVEKWSPRADTWTYVVKRLRQRHR